jgi:polynucleotide 5'-kinase involved in rRNA processing
MANVTISVSGPVKSGKTLLAALIVQTLLDGGFEVIFLAGEDNITVVDPLKLLVPQSDKK